MSNETKLDLSECPDLLKQLETNARADHLRSQLYIKDIQSNIHLRQKNIQHNEEIKKLYEYQTIIAAIQMVAVVSIALSLI